MGRVVGTASVDGRHPARTARMPGGRRGSSAGGPSGVLRPALLHGIARPDVPDSLAGAVYALPHTAHADSRLTTILCPGVHGRMVHEGLSEPMEEGRFAVGH